MILIENILMKKILIKKIQTKKIQTKDILIKKIKKKTNITHILKFISEVYEKHLFIIFLYIEMVNKY